MEYKELLKVALQEYDSFSLVWRDEFKFNKNCKSIQNALAEHLIKEEKTDEWPGTKIFGALATVRHYRVNENSLKILSSVNSFKEWLAPSYPEDLAFYKSGNVTYTSIAHEGESW